MKKQADFPCIPVSVLQSSTSSSSSSSSVAFLVFLLLQSLNFLWFVSLSSKSLHPFYYLGELMFWRLQLQLQYWITSRVDSQSCESSFGKSSDCYYVSTALLLNEVSEKRREIWNEILLRNLPRNSPRNFPCFPGMLKSPPPKFHQNFPIGDFKFQIEFQIKFHQKFHIHTSAGLAALSYYVSEFQEELILQKMHS